MIFLMGPTAIGKTDLAIQLTDHFPVEIISVDSAMVYKGMDIGTGKPNTSIPHHLIDICLPTEFYSAGKFIKDAKTCIAEIKQRNKIPLLVGGTMLYFRALQFGLSNLPLQDPEIRRKIQEQADEEGWPALHKKLADIDPEAALRIKLNDKQRLQRALEVYQLTGKTLSSYFVMQAKAGIDAPQVISLVPDDRQWLHKRIEQRFHKMLQQDLIEEARRLNIPPDSPAGRAVGYRQVLQYLSGKIDYETMVQTAIAATRQLAKRQLTWINHWDSAYEKVVLEENTSCLERLRKLIGIGQKD